MPTSITKNTYRRRRVTAQSTWKKSHASMVEACERRNWRHVVRLRCGAGGIRSRLRIRRTDPAGDHFSTKPAAGLHFVIFQPTIGNFIRTRLAMDGHYPDGTVLSLSPRSHNAGFNSILFTTHRQNYLVPPRSHRSFPLAEFLT